MAPSKKGVPDKHKQRGSKNSALIIIKAPEKIVRVRRAPVRLDSPAASDDQFDLDEPDSSDDDQAIFAE